MKKNAIFITGANGEIGQNLIRTLHAESPERPIVALDLKAPVKAIRDYIDDALVGDISSRSVYEQSLLGYEVGTIFHLAALLSTRAEFDPELAHRINVGGTLNLLNFAVQLGERQGVKVKVIFPSSIAVYGVKSKKNGLKSGIREEQHLHPITMYGVNKLYCEHLGAYYASHYKQNPALGVDFRCVRLPGVISADTMPSGGTSDYAPEMIHAAAQNKPYVAFVRPDTTIPFMAMPDAVSALLGLANAPLKKLARRVYNVSSFSRSAAEIAEVVHTYFPQCEVTFSPNPVRQQIVDSWPASINDSCARRDWGWKPRYDEQSAFAEYLIPGICSHYNISVR